MYVSFQKISSVTLLALFFLLSVSWHDASAQNTSDAATKQILQQLKRSIGNESKLYNGASVKEYEGKWEGTPFLDSTTNFYRGSVVYDNVLFENVPLQYDLIQDQVFSTFPNGVVKYTLVSEKVASFSFANRKFIQLADQNLQEPADLANGFFEEVYGNQSKVLIKRNKTVQKIVDTYGVRLKFSERIRYFILLNNVLHQVDNERGLLKLLSSKSDQIKKHLSNNQLKFKSSPVETLIAAASYYDSAN